MTPDQFKAGLAELDARIANAETRLTWRMLGIPDEAREAFRELGAGSRGSTAAGRVLALIDAVVQPLKDARPEPESWRQL